MIGFLQGQLIHKTPERVIVEVGGVGYEVTVPFSTYSRLPATGQLVRLHIHTHVREDAIQLFGFGDHEEVTLFRLLLGAHEIGPKIAMNILSVLGPADLRRAIAERDEATLRRVPGIGPKKVERLLVDLKDKVAPVGAPVPAAPAQTTERDDLLSALRNLGYKAEDADRAVAEVLRRNPGAAVEHLLKEALNYLYKR
ncbi:MAG: Holliday junction branch migration protein RuvA [Nitrospirae bacterium]|nr:Holliday junction branch migration protein RuvA [Nitrospirota bacterium]